MAVPFLYRIEGFRAEIIVRCGLGLPAESVKLVPSD
jgi:hypothetical protein